MRDTYLITLSASAAHWLTLAVLLYAGVYGLGMRYVRNREG